MKIKSLVLCALFAATTAVLAQAVIPIGLIPVNLAHVSVFLAAGLLGAHYGALSQLVYILIGVAGVPVFSGLRGGLGVLLGPTGGFLLGYMLSAFVSGFLMARKPTTVKWISLAILAGWFFTYAPGVLWFMFQQKTSATAALSACVLPFLPGDALKTVVCVLLLRRLRPLIPGLRPTEKA